MKFRVQRNDLFRQLQKLQAVTERRTLVPILTQVLLRATSDPGPGKEGAKKGRLEMTATDSEVTVATSCPAEVAETGTSTLLGRKLFDIARLLPEEEVSFDLQESRGMAIRCRESRFQIRGNAPEEFPRVPKLPEGEAVPFDLGILQSMIRRVAFATKAEDARYVYGGALLSEQGEDLEIVATDGHRLALVAAKSKYWLAEKWEANRKFRVILPRKVLSELERVGGNGDAVLRFWQSDNHLFFRSGPWNLISNAVEGNFAPYEKVIPTGHDKRIRVRAEEMLESVRRVGLLSSERTSLIELAARSGKLELSGRDPNLGEARETLEVEYQGEPIRISFNARYLSDFLSVVGSEWVWIDLKDSQAAGLFSPAEEESSLKYSYVVMPMHFGKGSE